MSHTPGPWYYFEDGPDNEKRRVIFGPSGSGMWKRAKDLPLEIVAQRKVDHEIVDSNWKLMKNSPMLLAALRLAVEHGRHSPACDIDCNCWIKTAKEAIREATGQG